jgi:peptidase E
MTTRRILASSGGFLAGERQGTVRPGPIFRRMLELTGKDRPRVCFVMTASGDAPDYLTMSYEALSAFTCDVTHLALFPQPNADVEERICGSDVVWVGGGSVANLLACWRLHGVDAAMRAAWEGGTILGGVSAGAICWHVGGTTDSFGPTLRPVTDGLGLLPFGCGVHYDSEEQRRPLLHALVGDGTLPTSYATDDRIGILYEGTEPVEVLSDRPETPAMAYRIERTSDGVAETALAPGRL